MGFKNWLIHMLGGYTFQDKCETWQRGWRAGFDHVHHYEEEASRAGWNAAIERAKEEIEMRYDNCDTETTAGAVHGYIARLAV